jgi:hypothetical protein
MACTQKKKLRWSLVEKIYLCREGFEKSFKKYRSFIEFDG